MSYNVLARQTFEKTSKYVDLKINGKLFPSWILANFKQYKLPPIIRKEGEDPENPDRVTFTLEPDGIAASQDPTLSSSRKKSNRTIDFDNYEIAHFRLISDTNFLPYGRSYIEPGRRIYKQLTLMEDAMLIHRIMRAPEKRMFYVNVGLSLIHI